ncbi:MAG TPA: dihydroorotate dehydrogenase electron transfer subunit [Dissulfurispiraceae bacterium]|nr:dihydroorotate dehydrogenase electron transfer subunit [Dissulfurispiraceae bacterium]
MLTLQPLQPVAVPVPGQFYMLQAGATHDPLLKRPFSYLSAENGSISFLYRIRGKGTRAIAALRENETISLIGPLGNAYPMPSGEFIAVAGGIGIASLFSLLGAATGRAALFWGGRTAGELLMTETVGGLVRNAVITTDDGSAGRKSMVTEPFREYLAVNTHLPVYVCGSNPMMKAVAAICADAGARCFVSLEAYMACGVGACLGCVVKIRDAESHEGRFRSVCKDGPVFDASTVVWEGQ